MHQYVMQIADKKFCHVGLLHLELGQELIVLSQKLVYGLITLTAYISCSILLFSQIQKKSSHARHLVLGTWEIFQSLQLRITGISGLKYLGSKYDTNALVLSTQAYWNPIFWFQISFEICGFPNRTRERQSVYHSSTSEQHFSPFLQCLLDIFFLHT